MQFQCFFFKPGVERGLQKQMQRKKKKHRKLSYGSGRQMEIFLHKNTLKFFFDWWTPNEGEGKRDKLRKKENISRIVQLPFPKARLKIKIDVCF